MGLLNVTLSHLHSHVIPHAVHTVALEIPFYLFPQNLSSEVNYYTIPSYSELYQPKYVIYIVSLIKCGSDKVVVVKSHFYYNTVLGSH
jgi:hypothetical protein